MAQKPSKNLEALNTERIVTDSRHADVVVFKEGSTYYADGRDALITQGSGAATVIQAAIDHLPDKSGSNTDPPSGGRIYIAAGRYIISSTIQVNRNCVTIVGAGFSSDFGGTILELGDGVDADMLTVDYHASKANSFFELKDIMMAGNKANNTSGRAIYIGPNERDNHIENVFINNFAGDGAQLDESWGSKVVDSLIENCGGRGLYLQSGAEGKVTNNKIIQNDGDNLECKANYVHIAHNELANSTSGAGLRIGGSWVGVVDNRIENNGDGTQMYVNGPKVRVVANTVAHDGTGTGVQMFNSAEDTQLTSNDVRAVASLVSETSGSTRPRWNGVIGGGPLGGVDLSSVNGQFDGDEAVSDGTDASTSAGDFARWDDGNAQWMFFTQDGTVT